MTRCRDDILKSLPLPMIAAIYDVHTHDLDRANAVVNLPLGAAVPPEGCYSVGIHPWDAGMADGAAVRWLRESAADSRVVAIGETGFDALRGGDMDRQEEVFREHASVRRLDDTTESIHNVRGRARLISRRPEAGTVGQEVPAGA